jgi:hypothetical protein
MKNKKTLYHFVLDKSGSMFNCIESTVNGYNAQLETIQKLQKEYPEQQFLVSLTIFDDIVDDVQLNQTIDAVEFLRMSRYRPSGTTALLDAIGMSINSIQIANESVILNNEMSIVMVILTDGLENASREFTFHQIAKTIKSLEETEKWTFNFLGADIDAIHTSKMLNIKSENVVSFNKSNMHEMMEHFSEGIRQYSHSKSRGITKNNFLDFLLNKDLRKK